MVYGMRERTQGFDCIMAGWCSARASACRTARAAERAERAGSGPADVLTELLGWLGLAFGSVARPQCPACPEPESRASREICRATGADRLARSAFLFLVWTSLTPVLLFCMLQACAGPRSSSTPSPEPCLWYPCQSPIHPARGPEPCRSLSHAGMRVAMTCAGPLLAPPYAHPVIMQPTPALHSIISSCSPARPSSAAWLCAKHAPSIRPKLRCSEALIAAPPAAYLPTPPPIAPVGTARTAPASLQSWLRPVRLGADRADTGEAVHG